MDITHNITKLELLGQYWVLTQNHNFWRCNKSKIHNHLVLLVLFKQIMPGLGENKKNKYGRNAWISSVQVKFFKKNAQDQQNLARMNNCETVTFIKCGLKQQLLKGTPLLPLEPWLDS